MRLPLYRCSDCGVVVMPYRDPVPAEIGDELHVKERHDNFQDNAHECYGQVVCIGFVEVAATPQLQSATLAHLLGEHARAAIAAGEDRGPKLDATRRAIFDYVDGEGR